MSSGRAPEALTPAEELASLEFHSSDTPSDRIVVPVRRVSDGIDVLFTGQMPDGTRTAIAFTSPALLEAAMGCGTAYDHLTLARLHEVLDPVGIERVQVDPDLVTSAFAGSRPAAQWRERCTPGGPQPVPH